VHGARPSSAARGYGGAWRKLRLMVLARQPLCAVPGCTNPSEHVDHIVAKGAGGTDDLHNLQGLCAHHHGVKCAKQDGAFGNRRALSSGH
jgi:5-methylcytosine-specific restriction protein A